MVNIAPPVMAGSDRFSDVYDFSKVKGFSNSEAADIAFYMPKTWDGMDALPKAFLRHCFNKYDYHLWAKENSRHYVQFTSDYDLSVYEKMHAECLVKYPDTVSTFQKPLQDG